MSALNQSTEENWITILNEIGVDQGIDHLYAIKIIDEVKPVTEEGPVRIHTFINSISLIRFWVSRVILWWTSGSVLQQSARLLINFPELSWLLLLWR
jgi:hypothetical protein